MAKLNMSMSHHLPQDEALARIKELLSIVKSEHSDKISDLEESWSGPVGRFSFKAMGYDISGTLTVKPDAVELDGTLPFAASLFRSTIESKIRERANALLA